jgi:hypothetical protein
LSSTIDTLHVRCVSTRAGERTALELRTRLASTARTHLPESLERRIDARGPRRVFVDRVAVRLDFDPSAYDDVTVATLWAAAIARELDGAGGEAAGVRVFADDAEFVSAAVVEAATRGELSWVFAELGCGTGRVAARAVLAALPDEAAVRAVVTALAASPAAALALARRLEAYERSLLACVLEGTLAWSALGLSPTAARAAVTETEGRALPPAGAREPADQRRGPSSRAGAPARPAAPRRAAYAQSSAPGAAHLAELIGRAAAGGFAALRWDETAAAQARERRERRDAAGHARAAAHSARAEHDARTREERTADAEPAADGVREGNAWWTTAGGLVYLYPWLGDLLDGRELRERVWALGAIVEPDAEQPLVDPLVRLLAGDDPARDPEPPLLPDDEDRAAHAADAERLLAGFAALLPGFAGSTPGYLRANVVHRGALLEPLADGSHRLLLEPAPLDPVLERLPYPLAAFRLPWTELVRPERRRA